MTASSGVANDVPQKPFGSSELAREVRRFKPGQRQAIGVVDEAILLWDVIISCAAVLIDDSDETLWYERLGTLVGQAFGDDPVTDLGKIERAGAYVEKFTKEDLPKWTNDLKKDGPVRFLVRMLGAATFRRCSIALRQDSAVLTTALRRATRGILPYAVALDDLYVTLPPSAATKLPGLVGSPSAALTLAVKLDELFGEKARDWGLPLTLFAAEGVEVNELRVEDLPEMVEGLREFASSRSRAAVAELSDALDRKMRGARDAIKHSADPIGQAATSLIELLDRILRAAFTENQVTSWVARNYPDAADMTYVPIDSRDGRVRPTKRAQALCFAHAGVDVESPSPLHELAAAAIVSTRTELQRLKHDDDGSPEDLEELQRLLAAVEGFMTLVVGVVWAAAPTEILDEFRGRLAPKKKV